jgi:hypothetical protein
MTLSSIDIEAEIIRMEREAEAYEAIVVDMFVAQHGDTWLALADE